MKSVNPTTKDALKQFKEELSNEFCQKTNITTITHKLVTYVDNTLLALFHKNNLHKGSHFCLLALGSYGRRELQLHSDIDLLLLHTETTSETDLARASAFISECWDIGLEISHQITTVQACAELASRDLTVISTILDMHLLCGHGRLMEELQYQTHPLHMWPSNNYFFAKQEEQKQRYSKYGETAYNLEPNVKQGPGGLRDVQILLSISKRHFGIKKLADGINCNFITDKEYEELMNCQHFLWRVRFALHFLSRKQEERLLFDHQIKIAALFGFKDNSDSLAIEQFMKAYFKIIKRGRELNEMLLQWFSETIVHHQKQQIIPINAYFQLSNHFIEVKHPDVFLENPHTLLELFLWIAKRPAILGVRASTIRLIRQHLFLIDKNFRSSSRITDYFLSIFKEENDPYKALNHMNKYGVLSHYLDCFAAVTGQMQYDLFHVYTVDQHTLFVIRNLVRFLNPEFSLQFPLATQLMASIKKKEILYLAALFHDIAKGRGGDHSVLGADEAQHFATRHHLNHEDTELLIWLVRHHLLMSQTAQRQDIYDPKTIHHFCSLLPDSDYLDYLYLLTVADICATNQTLWNSWKDSLLKELHNAASLAFQEQKMLLDEATLCNLRKQKALNLLTKDNFTSESIESLWQHFKSKYFLHESPEMIAFHTKAILTSVEFPVILILPHHSQGGTEVFIYMPHRDERFTITTTVLNNHQATIQEATILTCDNQFDLDTYVILDEDNRAFFDAERTTTIQKALMKALTNAQLPALSKRRLSRTLQHFSIKPQVLFDESNESQYSRLFLVAADRPGLLAQVSHIFSDFDIHLHNAKISTAGERAEDMFYISSKKGTSLSQEEKEALRNHLITKLT